MNSQVLHELEQQLHVELLPGTEIMTDVGSHHFLKAGNSNKVLVPQPSNDEHDPLVSLQFFQLNAE
jgi:predicted RNA binding protein YcfA (HicA-like mRNA interferase family)